jgi:predicted nucleic acid-binding protein
VYADRVVPLNADIAIRWGQLTAACECRGSPLPVIDGLIGATAVVMNMPVVTRNVAHLALTGAEIVNPWS